MHFDHERALDYFDDEASEGEVSIGRIVEIVENASNVRCDGNCGGLRIT